MERDLTDTDTAVTLKTEVAPAPEKVLPKLVDGDINTKYLAAGTQWFGWTAIHECTGRE